MNVKEKVYTEFIGLKVTKEQYCLLRETLQVKKKEKFSEKVREFIFSKIQGDLKAEYKLSQDEGIIGVYLYKAGTEDIIDTAFFDSEKAAMEYISSVGAIKKKTEQ